MNPAGIQHSIRSVNKQPVHMIRQTHQYHEMQTSVRDTVPYATHNHISTSVHPSLISYVTLLSILYFLTSVSYCFHIDKNIAAAFY